MAWGIFVVSEGQLIAYRMDRPRRPALPAPVISELPVPKLPELPEPPEIETPRWPLNKPLSGQVREFIAERPENFRLALRLYVQCRPHYLPEPYLSAVRARGVIEELEELHRLLGPHSYDVAGFYPALVRLHRVQHTVAAAYKLARQNLPDHPIIRRMYGPGQLRLFAVSQTG